MRTPISIVACVLVLALFAPRRAHATFEPDSAAQCVVGGNIDQIDHCCLCDGCDGSGSGSGIATSSYEITPTTAPLPVASENIGSSLVVSPGGERVVTDSFPGGVTGDQQVPVNTTVHVLELDAVNVGVFTHVAIDTVPEAPGHTLAASANYIAVGSPTLSPAKVTLYVKTVAPAWSAQYELDELSAGGEFGYALALDEGGDRLAASDPGYTSELGRVYVYLTQFDTLLDTLDHPTAPVTTTDDHRFGHAVALQSNTLVISSPGDDFSGTGEQDVGAVHVYEQVGTKWYLVVTFTPPGAAGGGETGRSLGWDVAVDGDWLVVGSKDSHFLEVYERTTQPTNEGPSGTIGAYTASVWAHSQTLTAPGLGATSQFGRSVAIYGARIAAGDALLFTSPSAQGKVFTYELFASPVAAWSHCQPFADEEGSFHSRFGQAVALSERYLVAGAPETDSVDNDSGEVWLLDLLRGDACLGCDGDINSCLVDDACGVCNGTDASCAGCDGVPNSALVDDYCVVCGGDNSTCVELISIEEHDEVDGVSVFASIVNASAFVVQATCNQPLQIRFNFEPAGNAPATWAIAVPPTLGAAEFDPDDDDSTIEAVDDDDDVLQYVSTNLAPAALLEDALTVEVTDANGNTATAVLTIQLQECVGCDAVANSGETYDDCGVCGGDSTSCLDCAGVLNGTSITDYCAACVVTANANQTCLDVADRAAQTVRCTRTVLIEDALWEPNFPSEIMRWEILSTHTDATVTIGTLNGRITYQHTGSSNIAADTITFQGKNTHDVVDTGTVAVSVTLCEQVGCDGMFGSGAILDACGVCEGSDACVDCNGVPNGGAMDDACGVCGGDGSTCGMVGAGNQISTGAIVALAVSVSIVLLVVCCIAVLVLYYQFRRPRQSRMSTTQFVAATPARYTTVPMLVRTTPINSDVNGDDATTVHRRRNVDAVRSQLAGGGGGGVTPQGEEYRINV